jgi:hypothetical protein
MANYKNEAEANRYQHQLSKLKEFRQTMNNKFFAGKANQKQRPEVTIPALHEDSAPLRGLELASVMEKRGVLRGWGGNC